MNAILLEWQKFRLLLLTGQIWTPLHCHISHIFPTAKTNLIISTSIKWWRSKMTVSWFPRMRLSILISLILDRLLRQIIVPFKENAFMMKSQECRHSSRTGQHFLREVFYFRSQETKYHMINIRLTRNLMKLSSSDARLINLLEPIKQANIH